MATDYSSISIGTVEELAKRVGDTLLAERYRDPTHFVYELLQNAEDALKDRFKEQPKGDFNRSVKFDLFPDRLELRHSGIPFGKAHIHAICDIARSSKTAKDDIQHFGIGFKSVYAFTKSPQIHSGDEHFWIESYVKPHALEPRQTGTGETLFVFPFDHSEKEPKECHLEIAARLRDLGLQTILFLGFIDEIEWRIDKQGSGRYSRKVSDLATSLRQFDLSGEENGRTLRSESWLVFSRSAEFIGREGRTIDVAYCLAEGPSKAKSHQIKRVKGSRLVALFPTDVPTALGFVIQGPYELTPSRDNLDLSRKKAREVNQRLIKETAKFVPETLEALKARGLLSISALDAALPLKVDELGDLGKFLAPVFGAVEHTLKKRPLIPGIGKNFVSGTSGVLVRGRELAELFKPEQLKLLLGSEEERQWISPDITADKKTTKELRDYLYYSVDVREISADDLPQLLNDNFLQAQKVDWFARFYRVLLKHQSLWSEDGGLRDKLIIRLADGRNVVPFGSDGANAFLPSAGEIGPKCIHPKLAKGESITFLKKLGIRERDSVAEVLEDVLPQYESGDTPAEAKHLKNLRRIFHALEQEECLDRRKLVDKLRDAAFLRATNAKTGKLEFHSPSSLLYFKRAELSEFFKGQDHCWFLAETTLSKKAQEWLAKLGVGELPALEEIPEEVKARREREAAPEELRKREVECTDYHLHGLEGVLKRVRKLSKADSKRAVKLSRIVWGILAGVADDDDGKFLRGSLKWKRPGARRAEEDAFDAYFVERLRDEAWLPNRKGQLCRPSEMQEHELPASFQRNRKLCVALRFQTPLSEKLKDAGIPPKLTKVLEMAQSDPQFADEFCRTWKRRGFMPPTSVGADKGLGEPNKVDGVKHPVGTKGPSGPSELPPNNKTEATETPTAATAQTSSDVGDLDVAGVKQKGDRTPRTDHLQTRVRAVAGTASESTPKTQEMSELRIRIDKAGIAAVKAFEEQAGRRVTELDHWHEGYDLESRGQTDEILRYIEVKATGSDWLGVLLSAPQFRAAQRLGDRYWLYVVENADSATPSVYPIQNPAALTEKFIFDHGWKEISTAQNTLP